MNFQEIELGKLKPNPMNPRKGFDQTKMEDLVASVQKQGIIQPIVVRPQNGGYEIVAGERRFKAAFKCNLQTIPAIVRELSDQEVFDIMTIENLQREDLTELEEAECFQAYLKKKGEKAIPELAERTGIDPRHIRRRIRVMTLPNPILEAWGKEKLTYSHLEQLRRLQDEKEIMERFRDVLDNRFGEGPMSVRELKRRIDQDALSLDGAPFKTKDAGCTTCAANTLTQKNLFGFDGGKGARCLNSRCYLEKATAWLTDHWKESTFYKKFKTTGFRLAHYDVNHFGFYARTPQKECLECKSFVTLLRKDNPAEVQEGRACVNPDCAGRQYKMSGGSSYREDPTKRAARLADEHGRLFRESFFAQEIPRIVEAIDPEKRFVDRLALAALIASNRDIGGWFKTRMPPDVRKISPPDENEWEKGYISNDEAWKCLKCLPDEYVRILAREAAYRVILQPQFGHEGRREVSRSLGIVLSRDWRINEEYLQKQTTARILELGQSLEIFKDPAAQTFLFEKLGKKRGKFDSCRKGELIRIFLESGVNLAGKVPPEILVKEKKCRKCGCTEDHACAGGCYWVEDDLCSSCITKKSKKDTK